MDVSHKISRVQRDRLTGEGHLEGERVSFVNASGLEIDCQDEPFASRIDVSQPVFVLGLELIDNFPHDKGKLIRLEEEEADFSSDLY